MSNVPIPEGRQPLPALAAYSGHWSVATTVLSTHKKLKFCVTRIQIEQVRGGHSIKDFHSTKSYFLVSEAGWYSRIPAASQDQVDLMLATPWVHRQHEYLPDSVKQSFTFPHRDPPLWNATH